MRLRNALFAAAAVLIFAPVMLVGSAAADPRDAARGGRLPIPQPQMPRAAPTLPPGGTLRSPDIVRPNTAGPARPPAMRIETPTVCIGGRMIGRSCLCADGSTKPALGQRVVRCATPARRR